MSKIAILMSTYNGERYIVEQIESILSQNCEMEMDLLVRDDGSTDGTIDVLNRYQAEGKLKWYSGDNLKPAKSFLDLMFKAKDYDFYSFADQDDYWHPDKLQRGIDAIKDIRYEAMYFSNAMLVDENRNSMGRNVYQHKINDDFYSLVISGGVLGCTIIFNSHLWKRICEAGIPDKVVMHDWYTSIVCSCFDGEIIYDEEATMEYRQHGNNVVGAQGSKLGALKNRVKRMLKKAPVSVSVQAQSILNLYGDRIEDEKKAWLIRVSEYKKNIRKTWGMAFSRKPKYNSRNMAITVRMSLLMRKH